MSEVYNPKRRKTFSTTSKPYIVISGLIGAGKTTIATKLAKYLGFKLNLEKVDQNPYLANFYTDHEKYSFPLQMWLLNERTKTQLSIIHNYDPDVLGDIQDRYIQEDHIFAEILHESKEMSDIDYKTYLDSYNTMTSSMQKPTLIIYLYTTVEQAMERINSRGRLMEKYIPKAYMEALFNGYEKHIPIFSKDVPVLRVDWSKYKSEEDMADAVIHKYDNLRQIHNLQFL